MPHNRTASNMSIDLEPPFHPTHQPHHFTTPQTLGPISRKRGHNSSPCSIPNDSPPPARPIKAMRLAVRTSPNHNSNSNAMHTFSPTVTNHNHTDNRPYAPRPTQVYTSLLQSLTPSSLLPPSTAPEFDAIRLLSGIATSTSGPTRNWPSFSPWESVTVLYVSYSVSSSDTGFKVLESVVPGLYAVSPRAQVLGLCVSNSVEGVGTGLGEGEVPVRRAPNKAGYLLGLMGLNQGQGGGVVVVDPAGRCRVLLPLGQGHGEFFGEAERVGRVLRDALRVLEGERGNDLV